MNTRQTLREEAQTDRPQQRRAHREPWGKQPPVGNSVPRGNNAHSEGGEPPTPTESGYDTLGEGAAEDGSEKQEGEEEDSGVRRGPAELTRGELTQTLAVKTHKNTPRAAEQVALRPQRHSHTGRSGAKLPELRAPLSEAGRGPCTLRQSI